jgi:hypothetical protein
MKVVGVFSENENGKETIRVFKTDKIWNNHLGERGIEVLGKNSVTADSTKGPLILAIMYLN